MKPGESYDLPVKVECPFCNYGMDMTFCTSGDHKPTPGCASLCIKCGAASIFSKNMKLRKPTAVEGLKLNSMPDVITAQIYIRGLKR